MRFIAYFAGRNAYRSIWLFLAMVVIYADTGTALSPRPLFVFTVSLISKILPENQTIVTFSVVRWKILEFEDFPRLNPTLT